MELGAAAAAISDGCMIGRRKVVEFGRASTTTRICVHDCRITRARTLEELGGGVLAVVCDACMIGRRKPVEFGRASSTTQIGVHDCRMTRARGAQEDQFTAEVVCEASQIRRSCRRTFSEEYHSNSSNAVASSDKPLCYS